MKFWSLAVLYVALIVAADYMAAKWVWPVGFGYRAPAGVFAIGVVLSVRDWIHEAGGLWRSLACVLVASLVSLVVGVATGWSGLRDIAVGSFVAFLFSETADALIYQPFEHRAPQLGLVLSNTVGAVIDSVIFLSIAFGDLTFLRGQMIGKWEMIPVGIGLVWLRRAGVPRVQMGADWARGLLVRPVE